MTRLLCAFLVVTAASACPPPRLDAGDGSGGVKYTITSDPSGADVSVDGVPKGVTPLTTSIKPGNRRISLSKSGYFPVEQTVEVSGGGNFSGRLTASH